MYTVKFFCKFTNFCGDNFTQIWLNYQGSSKNNIIMYKINMLIKLPTFVERIYYNVDKKQIAR